MTKTIAFNVCYFLGETIFGLWGLYTHNTGVGNLIKATAIASVFFAPLLFLCAAELRETDPRPKWIKVFLNWGEVVQVCILIWFGWMWCAAAFAFCGIASAIMRGRDGNGPISERFARIEAKKAK